MGPKSRTARKYRRFERLGLRHLTVERRDDVAFRREDATRHLMHFRGLRDELVRYRIDYLTDNGYTVFVAFRGGVFRNRVGCPKPSRKATLNRIRQITNGMLVNWRSAMGFNLYVAKIVSGGQTGVGRGALEAALKAQFPYGGMIPKGRLAEDGTVPEKFTDMVEAESEDYRFRMRWNVENTDATLILSLGEELEGGTQCTRQYCMNALKPYFVDNPSAPKLDGKRIAVFRWLEEINRKNNGRPPVLNVVGPRESKSSGIAAATEKYVGRLIAAQRYAEDELRKMGLIDLKVQFWEPYAIQMAEKGVDVVEQVPSWLPKIDVMTTERLSSSALFVHCVPRAKVMEVKQSIKGGVVHKLGWTEEPSHVVGISFVAEK